MEGRRTFKEAMSRPGYLIAPGAHDTLRAKLDEIAGFGAAYLTTDMDSGFGNAINVVRAVREYNKAGVAAFHLEDQVARKKCGHHDGKQLLSKA